MLNIIFNPFQSIAVFHTATSHLICTANQKADFYMECNTGLKQLPLSPMLSFIMVFSVTSQQYLQNAREIWYKGER